MFRIPLMKPFVNQDVKDKVMEVLDSGYLTEGPMTRSLEQAFKSYLPCRHALAATSATTGLEMALRAFGVGPGDEVIVPDFTYPATADVVAIVGATTVLVDVDPATFTIDYDSAERAVTPRTKAIIPVSEFGNPLDHDRLLALKAQYGIAVIEDAACALGSTFRNKRTGCWADITVFSLHPRKFITTGEGGMVVTNDDNLAQWIDHYKHFGIDGVDATGKPLFRSIGTNCKLSDLPAAVGVGQMQHIDMLLEKRHVLANRYLEKLQGDRHVQLPQTTHDGEHSWQSFAVRICDRDAVLKSMRQSGIEAQFGAFALHRQPAFQPSETCRWHGSLKGSATAFDQALVLPLHHQVQPEQQDEVVRTLKDTLQGRRHAA